MPTMDEAFPNPNARSERVIKLLEEQNKKLDELNKNVNLLATAMIRLVERLTPVAPKPVRIGKDKGNVK